jgi:hypothetical protein
MTSDEGLFRGINNESTGYWGSGRAGVANATTWLIILTMFWRTSMYRLSRYVLAWFVLSVGVAVAAPMVSPQSMAMVCTANGISLTKLSSAPSADGTAQAQDTAASSTMDCPLCWMPMGFTPTAVEWSAPVLAPLEPTYTAVHAPVLHPRYQRLARAPPAGAVLTTPI